MDKSRSSSPSSSCDSPFFPSASPGEESLANPLPQPEVLDPKMAEDWQAMEKEELTASLLELRRLLRESPVGGGGAELNLGSVLEVVNRLDESRAGHLRSLASREDESGQFKEIGRLLARRDWLVEAETAFRREIGVSPTDPETYDLLADVLRRQGKEDEAELAGRRAGDLREDGFTGEEPG